MQTSRAPNGFAARLGARQGEMLRDRSRVTATTQPDGSVVVEDRSGFARLTRLKPGVLFFYCRGYLQASFYEPMVAVAQHEMDLHGSLLLIVDGWEVGSIDTAFRESWTVWFKRYRDRFRMSLLVRTTLMVMAASLANLFTGISVITTYSNIDSWEKAAGRDVPGFRKRGAST